MKLKNFTSILLAGCLFIMTLGAAAPALAQQTAGSITGAVVDPSGSAIPNATVTVRDVDRGTTWTTKTTSAGLYDFPVISTGTVVVTAEAAGFNKEKRNSFVLSVNQVAKIDFTMKVGDVTATVDVVDVPPLLQTSSTEVGSLIDANAVGSLPLASRDVNQLELLAPGVVSTNIFAFQSSQNTFGTGRGFVNGAREQDNNATLDGMDINQPDNNDVAYVPSPDAIENFNIITSNAPADYGNYIGGVFVESIKSGTNKLHGTIYEYFRNTILDANTWQDKANAGLSLPDPNGDGGYYSPGTLPRPVLQWNNFGGAIGGPIIKDKLFFFADESNEINNTPKTAQNNTTLPSSAYLKGDLSTVCTEAGPNSGTFVNGVCSNPTLQLYSPTYLTGPNAGQIAPVGSRQPFLNNQVPISSKVAQALINLPAFSQQLQQSIYYTSGYVHNFQGDMKIDWQASPNDHIMGRYSQAFTKNITTYGSDVLTPNLSRTYPLKNFVVNYDRTISSSLVNEVRAGMQIFPANDQEYTNPLGNNLPASVGLPGVPVDILPALNFGYGQIGSADGVEIFHDTTIEAEDSLTWTKGHHSLHAGFELYHYIMNDVYSGSNGSAGQFTFNGQYTGNGAAGEGAGFADFLLGLPSQVAQGAPINFHLRNSLFAGFVQDNWTATHNLTLNIGLRYELTTARGDKNPGNNVNYDLVTGAPEIGTNYNTYKGIDNFQPRIGFAWQPGFVPHMVVRGAYDISTYMEGNGINNMALINPPKVIQNVENNNTGDALNYPASTLDEGYTTFAGATACTPAQLEAFAPNCLSGVQIHATDHNLQPAVDQQFSLAVEQQFGGNMTLNVGYVGNKDDHMSDIYIYNQKQIDPTTGVVTPGPYLQGVVAAGAQSRYNASDGISRYNALEVTLAQKRFHGLDYQVAYTFSKCMANSLGYFGTYGDEEGAGESQTEGTQNFFQNAYNPRGDYGRCTIDTANSVTSYAVYDLPMGRGKLIGAHVPRAVDAVVGGWKVAGTALFRSGFGITPFAGPYYGDLNQNSAASLTGSFEARPNCVSGVKSNTPMQTVQIGSSIGRVNLNPAAVTEVGDYQFGNCETGALRGPALKTANLDLTKEVPIEGQFNIVFAAQFINLTNTPIFSVPASYNPTYSACQACNGVRTTGPNGGQAGTVGSFGLLDGSNPGRQVELSVRLNY